VAHLYLTPENEERFFDLKVKIHQTLLQKIDLKRLRQQELQTVTERTIREIVDELTDDIPADIPRSLLIRELIHDSLGLGPLEDLMADEDITEIMVNSKDQIYVEKFGKMYLTEKQFLSDEQVVSVIQRIVAPLGRSISESKPMVDARLPDGSRVNAVIPPIAIRGPSLTIRRFPKIQMQMEDWIRYGSLNAKIADFLEICVTHKKNIIVTGGTSSGKTTLLNILASYIPNNERIITVEDAAELQLQQEHLVSLEARPANIEGKGEITFRDLVINCLRMRPDRIIIGECRGGEAIDMLQAMNTGHEGSMTTIHANNPRDSLSRLETMVLMSGMELPSRAIREQIALAIDIIIQTQRYSDGTRKIARILEVTGMEQDVILTQDIYLFHQRGIGENGKVFGEFMPTSIMPKFIGELKERGISIPTGIFLN
jgi:pilus assembly protein CpaF